MSSIKTKVDVEEQKGNVFILAPEIFKNGPIEKQPPRTMATNVAKKRKNIFARKPLTQTNQLHGTQDSDSSSSDDTFARPKNEYNNGIRRSTIKKAEKLQNQRLADKGGGKVGSKR